VQPRVYYAEQHHIREPLIDRDALFVLARLREAGFIAYLVGGSVRDLLLGRSPKDVDISTSARPEEIKALFRSCLLIGRRFRLAHVRFGKKVIEVSTFRAGEIDEARLIVRDNVWGTPEEDVYRRDFTINGLFYDPSDHKIIDYVGGFEDLRQNLLRTIGDPETRFHQDPVRMIRALKFRARFGFEIEPSILAVLPRCRGEILKSAPARLIEEFLRMLESGAAEPFLRLLHQQGFLELLLPELCEAGEEEGLERIFGHLHALDGWLRQEEPYKPERSLLLATLLFPLLADRLEQLFATSDVEPNLGEIHALADELVSKTLDGAVLKFPRRLRAVATFLLEAQYRLTPRGKKTARRRRFAHHPDFQPALQLLQLRVALHPELQPIYREWRELRGEEAVVAAEPRRAPKRRRRRHRA
jgi:poly(A) polymerase